MLLPFKTRKMSPSYNAKGDMLIKVENMSRTEMITPIKMYIFHYTIILFYFI